MSAVINPINPINPVDIVNDFKPVGLTQGPLVPNLAGPTVNDLKPNLIDPNLKMNMFNKLKAGNNDYWEPTRNALSDFYHNYIKPNWLIIIIVIILIIVLIWRYRVTKNRKEEEQLNAQLNAQINSQDVESQPKQVNQTNQANIEKYTNLVLELRKKNMEQQLEPKPVPVKYPHNIIFPPPAQPKIPKLAYPLYPYHNPGQNIPIGAANKTLQKLSNKKKSI
jgi:hypothetical protein